MTNQQDTNNNTMNAKFKIKPPSMLSNRGVLVVLSSNFLGASYIIDKKNVLIGRNDNCDIIINDPMISKKHCEISHDDEGKFYIEDMESKNSTFINGKTIKKKTHLIYGDRIILGNTILRFYLEEKLK